MKNTTKLAFYIELTQKARPRRAKQYIVHNVLMSDEPTVNEYLL